MAWYSRRNNPVADLPKDGIESVGMACGQSGKKANYKASVFAAYLGLGSAVLVARPLYLPQSWGWGKSHADWHRRIGVSASTSPRAKPRLALDMLSDLVSEGWLPVHWVTCNTHVWTARPELELAGPPRVLSFQPPRGRWVSWPTRSRPQPGGPSSCGRGPRAPRPFPSMEPISTRLKQRLHGPCFRTLQPGFMMEL